MFEVNDLTETFDKYEVNSVRLIGFVLYHEGKLKLYVSCTSSVTDMNIMYNRWNKFLYVLMSCEVTFCLTAISL
jgi:hypothetical protein